jgi:hypothetical protein
MRGGTQQEYTLADLTRITGAKRRSVQLWAEAGVIRAKRDTERRGTGTHRRFSRDEAIIACIVHAFARQQMAIGVLLTISRVVRSWLGQGRGQVENAIADKRNWFMVYQTSDKAPSIVIRDQQPSERYVSFPSDEILEKGGFAAVILLNTYLARLR